MAMEMETARRLRTLQQPTTEELDEFMATQPMPKDAGPRDTMTALREVQHRLRAPKGQYNSFSKFHYRSCEDILEAVKPLLYEYGLTLTISDEMVNIGDRYYVKATAAINGNEGRYIVTAYAREEETKKGMDASQITGSASSYARKYALNGLFCIDDTKDSDTDEQHRQQDATESAPAAPRAAERPAPRPAPQPAPDAPQRPSERSMQPNSGGPATKAQKGRLWHMSGRDDTVVAEWAAEYGETLDTLTKGTASALIDEKGEA
jgi:hypothetical protein